MKKEKTFSQQKTAKTLSHNKDSPKVFQPENLRFNTIHKIHTTHKKIAQKKCFMSTSKLLLYQSYFFAILIVFLVFS